MARALRLLKRHGADLGHQVAFCRCHSLPRLVTQVKESWLEKIGYLYIFYFRCAESKKQTKIENSKKRLNMMQIEHVFLWDRASSPAAWLPCSSYGMRYDIGSRATRYSRSPVAIFQALSKWLVQREGLFFSWILILVCSCHLNRSLTVWSLTVLTMFSQVESIFNQVLYAALMLLTACSGLQCACSMVVCNNANCCLEGWCHWWNMQVSILLIYHDLFFWKNMSPTKITFEDDFPFPQVGYVIVPFLGIYSGACLNPATVRK